MLDDRHGRVARADTDPRRRPPGGFRVGDVERFRRTVTDLLPTLPGPVAAALAGCAVVVAELPPDRPGAGAVPLVEVDLRGRRVRCVTLYRRPLEMRAVDVRDLTELVADAIVDEIADALGLDPDDPWD